MKQLNHSVLDNQVIIPKLHECLLLTICDIDKPLTLKKSYQTMQINWRNAFLILQKYFLKLYNLQSINIKKNYK